MWKSSVYKKKLSLIIKPWWTKCDNKERNCYKLCVGPQTVYILLIPQKAFPKLFQLVY